MIDASAVISGLGVVSPLGIGADLFWDGNGPRFYVGVFGLYPTLLMWGLVWLIARRKGHEPGHCRRCGYDLRASPDRCPECGAKRQSERRPTAS